jgi:hypothetical protein
MVLLLRIGFCFVGWFQCEAIDLGGLVDSHAAINFVIVTTL